MINNCIMIYEFLWRVGLFYVLLHVEAGKGFVFFLVLVQYWILMRALFSLLRIFFSTEYLTFFGSSGLFQRRL